MSGRTELYSLPVWGASFFSTSPGLTCLRAGLSFLSFFKATVVLVVASVVVLLILVGLFYTVWDGCGGVEVGRQGECGAALLFLLITSTTGVLDGARDNSDGCAARRSTAQDCECVTTHSSRVSLYIPNCVIE